MRLAPARMAPRPATAPPPEPMARQVRVLQAGFSGLFALWVHDLRHRETYGLRPDEAFPPASTIKLFVLREVFRQIEAGSASPGEELVLRRRDVVPGTGVLKDLTPGLRLSLEDAATLMVIVSDNVATNLLIDRLGAAAINRATREAGYACTELSGRLYHNGSRRSTTTAADLGRLMLEVARRRAVSRAASTAMLGILRRSQSRDIVGRFLPPEPEAGPRGRAGTTIASKGGALRGVRHDVAYVEGPCARYVVALMSRDCADPRYSVDNEATVCLARLARAVHDYASRPA
jgi:beta-lactamase class A